MRIQIDPEARWIEEMEVQQRLEWERRFSPPPGECPWGCDGSGWRELSRFGEDVQPEPGYDIFWEATWWTPCACNLASTHVKGERRVWIRHYPDGYINTINTTGG